jgi:hypothetical protein
MARPVVAGHRGTESHAERNVASANTINTSIMLIGCDERHIDGKANRLPHKGHVPAIIFHHIGNVIHNKYTQQRRAGPTVSSAMMELGR